MGTISKAPELKNSQRTGHSIGGWVEPIMMRPISTSGGGIVGGSKLAVVDVVEPIKDHEGLASETAT